MVVWLEIQHLVFNVHLAFHGRQARTSVKGVERENCVFSNGLKLHRPV